MRILDAHRQVLVDSGLRAEADEFVWIGPAVSVGLEPVDELLQVPIMILPRIGPARMEG